MTGGAAPAPRGPRCGDSKYVGDAGHSIGMRPIGASAPLKQLVQKLGWTVENVIEAARAKVRQSRRGADR